MINFSVHLARIYERLGVPATMTVGVAPAVTLTVIDDTRRKTAASGGVEVSSVGPGAYARMPELAAKGIAVGTWDGALLTFNGRTWIVRKGEMLGSPNGEDLGEVRLLLNKEATVG